MALDAPTFRRRPVSLTSLIDVIFLLLLFFMLSSTFTRFAELPLQNASGGAIALGGPPPLFLQLGPDALKLNGQPLSLESLMPALASEEGDEDRVVLITLAPEVTSQRLVDLLVVLKGAPWLTVSVLE